MKNFIHFILFTLLSAVLLFSCKQDEECRKKKTVALNAGFYYIEPDTVNVNNFKRKELIVDSLTVHGINIDSLLSKSKKTQSFYVYLNNFDTKCDYEISAKNIKDTISFYYKPELNYLSFECGCINLFTLDSVNSTKHYIDSIIIKSYDINTSDIQNIQIYHTNK